MDGDNKNGASKKKSILDVKSDKVGEETDLPSNSDKKEMEELKETVIKQKNGLVEKMREQGNKSQHCHHQTHMRMNGRT